MRRSGANKSCIVGEVVLWYLNTVIIATAVYCTITIGIVPDINMKAMICCDTCNNLLLWRYYWHADHTAAKCVCSLWLHFFLVMREWTIFCLCWIRQYKMFNFSLMLLYFGRIVYGMMTTLGAEVICGRVPGLTYRQREMCRTSPDAMVAVGDGIRLATDECKYQFRHHRWNCTAISNPNSFGHVVIVGE